MLEQRKAIIRRLEEARRILLYPHINMDGDTLGSSVALCIGLRQMGKSCHILIEDDIPAYLAFLDRGYCVRQAAGPVDLSLAVDCGDVSRIEKRKETFFAARHTACIDHHLLRVNFARYCYVDPEASATGLLVLDMLEELGVEVTAEMADALYVAIDTDTGSFRYANADRATHLAVAKLYQYGLDHLPLCNAIYDNIPLSQMLIESEALSRMELFAGGQAVLSYCTGEMLEKAGATMEQCGTIIDRLRSLQDVEVAVFLKEKEDGNFKASFRAKTYADVGALANRLGGGGHTKAAGCTMAGPLDKARELLKVAVSEALGEPS